MKLIVLPGFGHMLHHAAADRVVAAVEEIAAAVSAEARLRGGSDQPAKHRRREVRRVATLIHGDRTSNLGLHPRGRSDERDAYHVGRAGRAERHAGDDDDALAGFGEAFANAIWQARSTMSS